MRGQRLAPRLPRERLVDAVKSVIGVQAQLPSAMELSLRARVSGLASADIEAARVSERSLVRTWCMRGTLHLVASDDLGWLLSLLAPGIISGNARRSAQLGLDELTYAKAVRIIRDALAAHGPSTRSELVQQLAAHDIDASGQRAPYLVCRAAVEGVVCYGPDRGAEPTYVLLEDWLKPAPRLPREAALAELTRHYLDAYGPAEPRDLAVWSGLPVREARAGWQLIANGLTEVKVEGQTLWMLAGHADWLGEPLSAAPTVSLLPMFDTYLLGYNNRDFVVAPAHQNSIYHGGMMAPAVVVAGNAVGTWRYERRGRHVHIEVAPFQDLTAEARDLIAAEADDVGRFLELSVGLSYAEGSPGVSP
jgi:Winged helix DNA-binding domain